MSFGLFHIIGPQLVTCAKHTLRFDIDCTVLLHVKLWLSTSLLDCSTLFPHHSINLETLTLLHQSREWILYAIFDQIDVQSALGSSLLHVHQKDSTIGLIYLIWTKENTLAALILEGYQLNWDHGIDSQ
jgi:hypothetical protein